MLLWFSLRIWVQSFRAHNTSAKWNVIHTYYTESCQSVDLFLNDTFFFDNVSMKDCCIIFLRKVVFFGKRCKRCRINCNINNTWIEAILDIMYKWVLDFLKSVLTTIILRYTQKQKKVQSTEVSRKFSDSLKDDFLKSQESVLWNSLSCKRTITLHGRKIWAVPRSMNGTVYFF